MPLKMTDQQGDRFDGAIKRTVQFFIAGFQYPLVVSAVVNFSILILGGLNIHKCPVNNYIPIFMIVIGAVGLFSKFLSFLRSRIEHVGVLYCETALYSVEVVFFLLGKVYYGMASHQIALVTFSGTFWVYSEFKPSFDPVDKEKYCNKTAYLFAFIYLTLHYTIILAGINAALVLLYAIFFFMFAIGWVNLNNCKLSRLIPIYLIVAGE
ncbi:hypothetical protein BDFB_004996 [Asbolus verrucosus]|uniref:Uncharacterized protein n=1 Tax=Asbolus verrucosus TaxID=1661398 RepID=A0A482VA04_ASBVE|nr:hypothetical protein BDFB_004996 [Asbolus verrucosus]